MKAEKRIEKTGNVEVGMDNLDEVWESAKIMAIQIMQAQVNRLPKNTSVVVSNGTITSMATIIMQAQYGDYKLSIIDWLKSNWIGGSKESKAEYKKIERETIDKLDAIYQTFVNDKKAQAKLLDNAN